MSLLLTHPIHKGINLCVHVHGMRDDARCEMSSHLHVVAIEILPCRIDKILERTIFFRLRWLEGQTKVILESFQGGKRVLVHDELS